MSRINILNLILEDINTSNSKLLKIFPNFFWKFIYKCFIETLEKDIVNTLDKDVTTFLNDIKGNINSSVFQNLEENLYNFILVTRLLNFVKKDRNFFKDIKNFSEHDKKKEKIENDKSKGFYIESEKNIKLGININTLKDSNEFNTLDHILNEHTYFTRDVFVIFLRDKYKESNLTNYHSELSYLISKTETAFPELYPRKLNHGYGYEKYFRTNLNKIEKKLISKSLKLKD